MNLIPPEVLKLLERVAVSLEKIAGSLSTIVDKLEDSDE